MAAAAAALFAAALTVGASPVHAAPSTPTVEFSGGSVLSLLVCKSEPSTGSVSVPAESRVNFVNRLGQGATLKVDGKPVSSVQPNQAVPVVFKKGPVNVAMTFNCGVGVVEQFKPVSVGVTAPPPAPAAGQGAGQPGQAGQPASTTGPAGAAAAAANQAMNSNGRSTRKPSTTTSATTGEADDAGTEPVDPALLGPDATASPAANPSASADERVYVEEPVAASGPATNAPTGLLALVATVCVVGVGIAAIRAIIAQRSSRASYA
ncbi:hypothetical protein Daura_51280 [Dactylosporangium aurantiacum]|uniref:Uncharacterized protein n=1 Tax=Dactylosporangium aurantiacum TaxID=35754 RepID=A0A9Q9IKF9_9ACTN|nr:hypothetical protein [Dactylosporangium aurantiacum]MDG6101285.1 hypothetical protein [Dactylosporangium aurantiacum]UWZ54703.1 hypothetical protein Daura_51280 [Dactylosporangium aurantiacum]